MSFREAVHGVLGSTAPVELLPDNSKPKSGSRRSSTAGGNGTELAPEPVLSPTHSDDDTVATDDAAAEGSLPSEPAWPVNHENE